MRKLSDVESISLAAVLKMECDGLIMQKAMTTLISDEEFKKLSESGILAAEGRIKAIEQFIVENNIPVAKEE